jgi:prevent-host-death family protein
MMKQVGVYDAKTHLPKLLDEVEHGETIEITRHGKPVARIVPISKPKRTPAEVIADIREARKGVRLNGLTIKELVEEGRR